MKLREYSLSEREYPDRTRLHNTFLYGMTTERKLCSKSKEKEGLAGMLKNSRIKYLSYCRECLNEVYGTKLRRNDVMIFEFPKQCQRCMKTKNIVAKIRPMKKWKLVFAHRKN